VQNGRAVIADASSIDIRPVVNRFVTQAVTLSGSTPREPFVGVFSTIVGASVVPYGA